MMARQETPTAQAPVDGRPVVLGGVMYIVPPLTLYAVRQFAERLKTLDLSGGMDPDKLDLLAQVVHAAVKRNYPDMTYEELLEKLDLGNVHSVFEAVMGVSGFTPAAGGDPPGESTGRS